MTAVVLGAGGAAGWAFHAGVVAGLADVGRPLATASVVVATSAGAPVAASVLAGATPERVVAELLRAPTPDEISRFRTTMADARAQWWRRLRPAAPRLARAALPGGAGVGVAVAGMLPAGVFPTAPLRRSPGVEALGTDWPDGLWIPAVRLRDGTRVVFGRDRRDVDVATAVEASQAVPIMFTPPTIDGEDYVDGATHSPTNADLVMAWPGLTSPARPTDPARDGTGVDLDVLVVAPMSRHPNPVLARFAQRRLRQERDELRAAGRHVVVVVPDDDVAATLAGFPRRDPDAIPTVVAAGRAAIRTALG